jgi:hypothetical protein
MKSQSYVRRVGNWSWKQEFILMVIHLLAAGLVRFCLVAFF